jgi:hypothetical protein
MGQMPMGQMPMGQMPMGQMPVQGGYMAQGINMGSYPAIYSMSQPQAAQLYTSGVPGVPPTIAVSTDPVQMGGFMMPPKPIRNSTRRNKSVSFGDEEQSVGTAPVTINVIKGN